MSLYKNNRTSSDKETSGTWMDFDRNSKGEPIRILVAREGGRNIPYQKTAEHFFKPYRRQIQHGNIHPVQLDSILAKVYAKAVVKGWEGVEDENDQPLDFNEENVIKVLTDLPPLFDAIKEHARDFTHYLLEDLEEDAKN